MSHKRTVFYSSWMPDDSGGAQIVEGIREELGFEGYCLEAPLISHTNNAERIHEESRRIQRCIDDPEFAGIILMPTGDSPDITLLRRLRDQGKAVVFVERMPSEDRNFDWVGIDNVMAARQIVDHLIQQGHRSIAHITTNETISTVRDRLLGYRRALETAGIPYRSELVVPHSNDWRGIDVPQQLLRSLFALPNPPTAIFTVHDWAALLTMINAHLMGEQIPARLSIAGFDGIERFWQERSLLTTAEIPFSRLGRQSAKLLIERIEGRVGAAVKHVSLEAPVRTRFSTQCDTSVSLLDESAWRGRLVYHYMREHLEEPLTIEHLAAIARVSVRTLFQDFERRGNQSPMHELLALRLEQVHWELTHPNPDTTVSVCAAKCGLHHLGRLAAAYKERYGTTPSQTLRRALEESAHPA